MNSSVPPMAQPDPSDYQQAAADLERQQQEARRERLEFLGAFAGNHWHLPVTLASHFCAELLKRYPRYFLVAHDDLANASIKGGRLLTLHTGGSWASEPHAAIGIIEQFGEEILKAMGDELAVLSKGAHKDWKARISAIRQAIKSFKTEQGLAQLARLCGQAFQLGDSDALHCTERQLASDTHWIGAPNGVIDLERGYFQTDIDMARAHFVVGCLPDPYDPDATSPLVDKLFAHLEPTVKQYLLQSIAFALRGYPSRRFLILLGAGGGGKSTLMQALSAALGIYAGTVSEDAFTRKRHTAGLNPSVRALIAPRRLAFISEANKAIYSTERLKSLSGDDSQTWRDLFQSERTDRVTATLLMAANDLPRLDATDAALMDRMNILPYPSIPAAARDGDFMRAFSNPRARQALVAAIVRAGADRFEAPTPPQAVIDATNAAQADLIGEVGAWVLERVERSPTHKLSTAFVWAQVCQNFEVKDGRAGDLDRRQVSRIISAKLNQNTKSMRIDGKVMGGWYARWNP